MSWPEEWRLCTLEATFLRMKTTTAAVTVFASLLAIPAASLDLSPQKLALRGGFSLNPDQGHGGVQHRDFHSQAILLGEYELSGVSHHTLVISPLEFAKCHSERSEESGVLGGNSPHPDAIGVQPLRSFRMKSYQSPVDWVLAVGSGMGREYLITDLGSD